ncbi:hypothetical protein [Jannaschia sp. M317]|nr:hypothetical protein [Jannaschia sp. M317]
MPYTLTIPLTMLLTLLMSVAILPQAISADAMPVRIDAPLDN